MRSVEQLLENNRTWATAIQERDPEFFPRLSRQQSPEYLWIGCSDSRMPASQIVGLGPGQLFVHRNVANVVAHTDLNCLSVLQYAVDALKVQHVIVCGHYGCGGVYAALHDSRLGLIDNWLRQVRDVMQKHQEQLVAIADGTERLNRLCELNVIEQVSNVCRTTIVQQAWERGQTLTVHGWIYGLHNGLLRDLNISIADPDEALARYQEAVAATFR
jgi:carbonic anhydrase